MKSFHTLLLLICISIYFIHNTPLIIKLLIVSIKIFKFFIVVKKLQCHMMMILI